MILWLHYFRPRSAWYKLSKEQQQELLASWTATREETATSGEAEFQGLYSIRGQSTQERLEVWRFETIDTLQAHWQRLEDTEYLDWRETENVVGTEPIPYER